MENTTLQELLIFTKIIFPIIFMITATIFITRKALSLVCHVAQEIIHSALKHTQLKMNNKFWRELCIIHDDKKVTEWKAGRLKVTNVHSSSLKISHGIRISGIIRADSVDSKFSHLYYSLSLYKIKQKHALGGKGGWEA